MRRSADIVIIGAGVAGCATAAHLLQLDPSLDVLLLDRAHVGAGSTSRSMAAFRHQWSVAPHVAFSRYASTLYERFAEEGRPVNFRRNGYLFLYEEESDLERARLRVQRQQSLGVEGVQVLAPEQLADAVPCGHAIAVNGLAGAVLGSRDGFLDALAVAQAFLDEARAAGLTYRPGTRVTAIEASKGRVRGARTADGEEIAADRIVNAAGPWSVEVARSAGLDLPLRPAKRYLYQTRPLRETDVSGWPMVIGRQNAHFRPAEGNTLILAWEQRPDPLAGIPEGDGLWVNQDRIEPGYGLGQEEYGIAIVAILAERVPMMAEKIALAHVTCGWYTMTPDHKAILARDPRLSGLYHATGFSGHGIMHGAATGCCMAELLLDRPTTLLSPDAFEMHFGLEPLLEGRMREPIEDMVL